MAVTRAATKTGDPRAAHSVAHLHRRLRAFGMDRRSKLPLAQLFAEGNLQETAAMTYVRSYRRSVRRGLARVVYVRPYVRRR